MANFREDNLQIPANDFAPIVEITGEGTAVYVRFDSQATYSHTVERSTWPVLNIDIGTKGEVIGIEAIGYSEFTLSTIAQNAGLKVPDSVAARARYVHKSLATA